MSVAWRAPVVWTALHEQPLWHEREHEGPADAPDLPAAAGAGPGLRPEAAAAAWRLAWLGAELGDGRLAAFAGELLALAGPLPPGAVAFAPPALEPVDAAAPSALSGWQAPPFVGKLVVERRGFPAWCT